jgi:CRISPR system Cascade subunit CasB
LSEQQSGPSFGSKVYLWWWDLQDLQKDGKTPNWKADRAARARLRRADPNDVFMDEAVVDLYRRLYGAGAPFDEKKMSLALRLALVLAHIRKDQKGDFAAALGEGGEQAKLKPLRFKKLLQADENAEIIRGFRRAIALLDKAADVERLANTLLFWEREDTRTRFAFSYFGAGAAAPAFGQ